MTATVEFDRHGPLAVAMTFRQFASAYRNSVRSQYGCTVAEARAAHPDMYLRPQWVNRMVAFAAADGDIPSRVARTLTEPERYAINKFGYGFNRYV